MLKKAIIVFLAIVLSLCHLSGCVKSPQEIAKWNSFSPVPFDGYICGFETQKILIQLPFFYLSVDPIEIDDISNIVLRGTNTILCCDDINILHPHKNIDRGYCLSTLTFRVIMPSPGSYVINRILITLCDNRTIERALGDIMFEVVKSTDWNDSIFFASNFMINQVDYSAIKVTYVNNSSEVTEITKVSYLDNMYSGVNIEKFIDVGCTTPEEGLWIPAGANRTFVFSFVPNDNFFSKKDEFFLFLLPFVEITSDSTTGFVPMQSQALIIQPPFSERYVEKLLINSSNSQ